MRIDIDLPLLSAIPELESAEYLGITTVDVDPQVVAATRETFPMLRDRYGAFAAEGNRARAVPLKGVLTR